MPLKDLYAKLLSIGYIVLILVLPLQPLCHVWYKLDLTCEYHSGNSGHGIETCYAFKKRLLELIKIGWVTFKDSINVNLNMLPNYATGNSWVGMAEVESKDSFLSLCKGYTTCWYN
jgi:hypothetical protein